MPTDYTSRDFASVKADLIGRARSSLPEWVSNTTPDFAMLLVDLWSYIADVQNYYIDRAHTEAFLDTATQSSSVRALARMMGYVPNVRTSSSATLTISNSSSATIEILAGTLFQVPATSSKSAVYFTSRSSVSPLAGGSATITLDEGRQVTETLTTNFTGDAGSAFLLTEQKVVPASLSVTVGTTTYTHTQRIFDVGANVPAFTSLTDSSDNTRIVLGNGINGRIPPAGSTIKVTYRVGQGPLGNVAANTITVMDSPVLHLAISSSTAASGGSDPETMVSIKKNAPALRNVQDRAVTLADYKTLMKGFAGVTKAVALSSVSSGAVTVKYAALPTYTNYENLDSTISTLWLAPTSVVDTGTAQAGSTTTITLKSGSSAVNDYYNGMTVTISSGTGSGQSASITDYVGSTKVATAAFTTAPASNSVYSISAGTTQNFAAAGEEVNSDMTAYLQERSMVGVTVSPISTTINLTNVYIVFNSLVVSEGYYQEAVKTAVDTTLRNLFAWDRLDFNTAVSYSGLMAAIQKVDGVSSAYISHLGATSSGTSVGDHMPTATTTSAVSLPVLRGITFSGVSGGIS
jgi:hypothetical protein